MCDYIKLRIYIFVCVYIYIFATVTVFEKLSVIRPLRLLYSPKASDSAFMPHNSMSNVSDSWSDMSVPLTLCRLTS